ncbi:MAG TPA: allantoicase [Pilimelia sp.]|nr:allantoicase [Pilimelia sp.]
MNFEDLPDLASRRLGGGVVAANDEFFAAADHLVAAEPPAFTPGVFGPKGQVYDGWETRRRREPGHDHAIVRLGAPGVVRGVVVDTAFFTGNYPPSASVEACGVEGYPSPAELAAADWVTLVPRSPLAGDARNPFPVDVARRFTHIRLTIYPDGGVARLRVHGEVVPDPRLLPDGLADLAAAEHGGRVVDCSDMFYGSPANLIMPGLARVMGEGWETARRRDDGNDWVVVRLAARGRILLAELDTTHFKGNAPGAAALRGIDATAADVSDPAAWFDLLPRVRLQPDTRHRFPLAGSARATHVRLDVFPDGGMARLRLWGRLGAEELGDLALRWFSLLPEAQARDVLTRSTQLFKSWGVDEGSIRRLLKS